MVCEIKTHIRGQTEHDLHGLRELPGTNLMYMFGYVQRTYGIDRDTAGHTLRYIKIKKYFMNILINSDDLHHLSSKSTSHSCLPY